MGVIRSIVQVGQSWRLSVGGWRPTHFLGLTQQNVFRFEVAVNDPLLLQKAKAFDQLYSEPPHDPE